MKKVIISNNNEIIEASVYEQDIKNMIYTVRGKQIILDSDVAKLYHYETRRINETVKRNMERFPERFCFQLTESEFQSLRFQNGTLENELVKESKGTFLRSQIATLKEDNGRGKHRKYLPYVFTEQGIAMLSGLLKSEIAVTVSIRIMDAFVEMRKFLTLNGQLFERLTCVEYKLLEHDKKFDKVFNELEQGENIKQRIFFEGQIYDAYSLVVDIIKKANKSIYIIDNYIDDSVLKILAKKNKNVEVTIVTTDKSNIQKIDIQKFNKEYPELKVLRTNKFHDRFVIIDEKEMYHLGASIKDLGKKCFGINKIEDTMLIKQIMSLGDCDKRIAYLV